MAVSNSFRQTKFSWMPDADSVNAPEGALLRADNLVPDSLGAASLRRGSSTVYSGLAAQEIDSLHTVELSDGVTYRAMGVDNTLYIDGLPKGDPFDGTGDISFGNDSYQIFAARGTKKVKWDGTTLNNWGIAAPEAAPTLAAVTAITSTVAQFDTSESPAVTAVEGSLASTTDVGGSADSAKTLTPNSSSNRGTAQRLFTTDQDFMNFSGTVGSETDMFDISVKFEDPRNVASVQIVFGCDDSSTIPFTTDRFEFTFNIEDGLEIPIKDLASQGYSAYDAAVSGIVNSVDPTLVTSVQTPGQVKSAINAVGTVPSPKVTNPPDGSVWGHLTVTRGQFSRIGNTASRGWDTVRGFKVVYTTKKGFTSTATFADALFVGGGDRSLTGTYRCVIRAGRSFGKYIELGPPSPESDPINLNHQTLQVTISSTVLSGLDPQVDQLWVYLFGGFLDTYYRFAIASSEVRTGMSIDELTNPAGSDFDTPGDRTRLSTWGFTVAQGGATAPVNLVMTIDKAEIDAVAEGERLEPYQMLPPDNIVAIAGPWKNRIFTLTSDGYVYPSSNRRPSSFNSFQVLDLTRWGNPLWMVKAANGIYVGMEKDIIFLAGSADDSTDLTQIDLYPEPLNVGNPPFDKCVHVDGNVIIYRSTDSLMMLTGGSLQRFDMGNTNLLWRGLDRHGVSAPNLTSGRFRCTVDNFIFYILVPEGSTTEASNVIYRYNFDLREWSRFVFTQVSAFRSIYKEPDGTLLAGSDDGTLWMLEDGTQDDGSDIVTNIVTPIMDAGNPIVRKTAHDMQLHCNTAGDTGTVSAYLDGDGTATSSYSFSTSKPQIYHINTSDLGTFTKIQLGLTGSFSTFALHSFDMGFREHPQHMVNLDTGYLAGSEPADLLWMQEIEFDTIAEGDVDISLYIDDVLYYSTSLSDSSVTPTFGAGARTVYRIPLPRGSVGRRPRIVLSASGGDGEGAIGFDPYSVRVRTRSTGNQDQSRRYFKVWPAGESS